MSGYSLPSFPFKQKDSHWRHKYIYGASFSFSVVQSFTGTLLSGKTANGDPWICEVKYRENTSGHVERNEFVTSLKGNGQLARCDKI